MRRIRVLEAIAGADFSWAPGDVVEVSEEAATSWADGHRAVLVDGGQEQDGVQQPSTVHHQVPVVFGEDGAPLQVLASTVEETGPPDAAEDNGQKWVRWSVTIRLPVPAAPDDEQPPRPEDPADLENEDPDQEAEAPAPPTPFDPREHTNREVLAYLDTVGEQEALRVLDIEADQDTPRAGICKNRDQVLADARARDAATGGSQAGAEKAADYSRGGGGEPSPETRAW
ncbi:hypothetical protein [Streptomyces sp. STR69]|uniref:hypothetical protein n=1 Tax=Streptomyces sp. STR69 TaxID=1796942 RepID=UPI0021CA9615|nr:hypothetical protein [Streptomyces sp. STR69]